MSYIQDIDFDFHVGDSFDLSPAEGSYVISKILAVGGELYIDGNTIIILSLPGQEAPAPAPAAEPAPAPVEAPEVPAAVEAPGLLDAPPVEEVIEESAPVAEVEASDEVVETPISVPAPKAARGRKPAAKSVEVSEEA